jgi:hypothetical protein
MVGSRSLSQAVVQVGQAVDHGELAVELAQLLAPPQLRIGGADAEGQQTQQIARQHMRFIDQLPHQLGLDHQHISFFQRRDGIQIGLFVEHGLFAHAFARQYLADGAIGHAGTGVGGNRQCTAQDDVQVGNLRFGDAFIGRQPHDGAGGQQSGHGVSVGGIAQQLQIADLVVRGAEGADVFQSGLSECC